MAPPKTTTLLFVYSTNLYCWIGFEHWFYSFCERICAKTWFLIIGECSLPRCRSCRCPNESGLSLEMCLTSRLSLFDGNVASLLGIILSTWLLIFRLLIDSIESQLVHRSSDHNFCCCDHVVLLLFWVGSISTIRAFVYVSLCWIDDLFPWSPQPTIPRY